MMDLKPGHVDLAPEAGAERPDVEASLKDNSKSVRDKARQKQCVDMIKYVLQNRMDYWENVGEAGKS